MPLELALLDPHDELLATAAEARIAPVMRRHHPRRVRVASDPLPPEPDGGLPRDGNLQQEEVTKWLGPEPDARPVPVIDERHAIHLRAAHADIEPLTAANDIQAMRHEQRPDMLASSVQVARAIAMLAVQCGQRVPPFNVH